MTSTIKVNNIQNQCGANIINENSNTITLGASGDTIALASGASQTGFGRTGTVDWDTTPKTATFSAVSGDGFFCNTTAGSFTCNLPAGSAGAIVSLADYAGTWQTNKLIVSPNGTDKIGSVNSDVNLTTEGQSVTFIFVDSTQGWINTMDSTSNVRGNAFITATGGTVTTSGNCKIHTFTGPGTFTVSAAAACATNNTVSYLVIAGGGGGKGGGAGAGGFREVVSPSAPYTGSPSNGYPSSPNRVTVSAQAYPITVGGGGTGGSADGPIESGVKGAVSTFSTITSAGGGGGRDWGSEEGPSNNYNGGSGGGGGQRSTQGAVGGTGNTPPTTPAQGTNGGLSQDNPGTDGGAGGGGGAGGVGVNGTSGQSGNGGNGQTTEITASPVIYAGGGGGGGRIPGSAAGSGGPGGGGAGIAGGPGTATSGTANRGAGGGGGGYTSAMGTGGNGGSGIVVIRYKFQ